MNPIEAMARAMLADEHLRPEHAQDLWDSESAEMQAYWIRQARVAINALADNVSDKMVEACELEWSFEEGLRSAIRAAGEG